MKLYIILIFIIFLFFTILFFKKEIKENFEESNTKTLKEAIELKTIEYKKILESKDTNPEERDDAQYELDFVKKFENNILNIEKLHKDKKLKEYVLNNINIDLDLFNLGHLHILKKSIINYKITQLDKVEKFKDIYNKIKKVEDVITYDYLEHYIYVLLNLNKNKEMITELNKSDKIILKENKEICDIFIKTNTMQEYNLIIAFLLNSELINERVNDVYEYFRKLYITNNDKIFKFDLSISWVYSIFFTKNNQEFFDNINDKCKNGPSLINKNSIYKNFKLENITKSFKIFLTAPINISKDGKNDLYNYKKKLINSKNVLIPNINENVYNLIMSKLNILNKFFFNLYDTYLYEDIKFIYFTNINFKNKQQSKTVFNIYYKLNDNINSFDLIKEDMNFNNEIIGSIDLSKNNLEIEFDEIFLKKIKNTDLYPEEMKMIRNLKLFYNNICKKVKDIYYNIINLECDVYTENVFIAYNVNNKLHNIFYFNNFHKNIENKYYKFEDNKLKKKNIQPCNKLCCICNNITESFSIQNSCSKIDKNIETMQPNFLMKLKYQIIYPNEYSLKLTKNNNDLPKFYEDINKNINKFYRDKILLLVHILNIKDFRFLYLILNLFKNSVIYNTIYNEIVNSYVIDKFDIKIKGDIISNFTPYFLDYVELDNNKKKYFEHTNESYRFKYYLEINSDYFDTFGPIIYNILLRLIYLNSENIQNNFKTKISNLGEGESSLIYKIDDSFMNDLEKYTIYTRNYTILKLIKDDYECIKSKINVLKPEDLITNDLKVKLITNKENNKSVYIYKIKDINSINNIKYEHYNKQNKISDVNNQKFLNLFKLENKKFKLFNNIEYDDENGEATHINIDVNEYFNSKKIFINEKKYINPKYYKFEYDKDKKTFGVKGKLNKIIPVNNISEKYKVKFLNLPIFDEYTLKITRVDNRGFEIRYGKNYSIVRDTFIYKSNYIIDNIEKIIESNIQTVSSSSSKVKLKTKEHFANICTDKKLHSGEFIDNMNNAVDGRFTCKDYKDLGLCENGEIVKDKYISVSENDRNIDAKDACCVCGGGSYSDLIANEDLIISVLKKEEDTLKLLETEQKEEDILLDTRLNVHVNVDGNVNKVTLLKGSDILETYETKKDNLTDSVLKINQLKNNIAKIEKKNNYREIQISQIEIIKDSNKINTIININLGTNNIFNEEQIEDIKEVIKTYYKNQNNDFKITIGHTIIGSNKTFTLQFYLSIFRLTEVHIETEMGIKKDDINDILTTVVGEDSKIEEEKKNIFVILNKSLDNYNNFQKEKMKKDIAEKLLAKYNLNPEIYKIVVILGKGSVKVYVKIFKNNNISPGPSPDMSMAPSPDMSMAPSPDMSMAPSPDMSMAPSPDMSMAPSPGDNTDTKLSGEIETLKVLLPNNKEKIEIVNNLKKIFNLETIDIEYEEINNNLIIKLPDVIFKDLKGITLLNIKELLQDLYYNKYRNKIVDKSQIIIEFIPGSLIIMIKILKDSLNFKLTEDEKDLLEYHNFQRVFFKGLYPITEYEYILSRSNYLKKYKGIE